MDDHANRQANGVGEEMALAALDHLLGSTTPRATGLGGFDRPAVDHPRGRARLAKVPPAKPRESQTRVASRPAAFRTSISSTCLIVYQTLLSRQA
jgi:hypothetical protein